MPKRRVKARLREDRRNATLAERDLGAGLCARSAGYWSEAAGAHCCFDSIESLDPAVADRCAALLQQTDMIHDSTLLRCCTGASKELISRRWEMV